MDNAEGLCVPSAARSQCWPVRWNGTGFMTLNQLQSCLGENTLTRPVRGGLTRKTYD